MNVFRCRGVEKRHPTKDVSGTLKLTEFGVEFQRKQPNRQVEWIKVGNIRSVSWQPFGSRKERLMDVLIATRTGYTHHFGKLQLDQKDQLDAFVRQHFGVTMKRFDWRQSTECKSKKYVSESDSSGDEEERTAVKMVKPVEESDRTATGETATDPDTTTGDQVEPENTQRKGHYKTLQVDHWAGGDEIKKAYRLLAMAHHPDRHMTVEEEERKKHEEKFKKVDEAYQVLSDSEKRQRYDFELEMGDSN